jgi:hypothetical protein
VGARKGTQRPQGAPQTETFSAPPGTHLEGKLHKPTRSESLGCGIGSTWSRDVSENTAALTAPVATLGAHSHALPPQTVAEALSCLDANKLQAAIYEELGPCQTFGVWDEVHLLKGKHSLQSFFTFEIKRDGRYKARLVAGRH